LHQFAFGRAIVVSLPSALAASMSACGAPPAAALAPAPAPPPPKPQLAVREFQTRTYDTTDTPMVMKAVLNALQDEGFIIKNANDTLGLCTPASKSQEVGYQGWSAHFQEFIPIFHEGLAWIPKAIPTAFHTAPVNYCVSVGMGCPHTGFVAPDRTLICLPS
jgi:hypothetical protein